MRYVSLVLTALCMCYIASLCITGQDYFGDSDEARLPDGEGVMLWMDGSWYRGQWSHGQRVGEGVYYKGARVYDGLWENDDLSYGTMNYTAEDGVEATYVGYLKFLKPDGKGLLKAGSYAYEGQWRLGKKDGFGRENGDSMALYEQDKRTDRIVVTQQKQYGIDISHFQPEVCWNELYLPIDSAYNYNDTIERQTAVAPVSFVYFKATEGETFFDNCYDTHLRNAIRHGIRHGAYHFYSNKVSATVQAQNFINHVERGVHSLPPVLDIEISRVPVDSLLKWLEIVERHYGVKPIVYTNERYAKAYYDYTRLRDYRLWYARYNKKPLARRNAFMHQFSEKGRIKGIKTGPVDLDSICVHSSPLSGQ